MASEVWGSFSRAAVGGEAGDPAFGVSEERAEEGPQEQDADHRGDRARRVAYEGADREAEHRRHREGRGDAEQGR
ncbi:hypothetical protein ABMX48_24655 [Streptomyces cavourensis]